MISDGEIIGEEEILNNKNWQYTIIVASTEADIIYFSKQVYLLLLFYCCDYEF